MRTYGRVASETDPRGYTWQEVDTDAKGFNDAVYLTTLAQVLKLNLGESPFWSNYGIPQYQTIVTQVFPDYYVAQTQSQMSGYFVSLSLQRQNSKGDPVYAVRAVMHDGAIVTGSIAQ